MPNGNVEERIVEMRIDNQKFESGAKQTISTLEKLERALHLKGDTSSLNELSESVSKFDASPMTNSIEKVQATFSALEVAGLRVIQNLTDSVYNFATRTIKGLTIDQVTEGYSKYEEKTAAVQTIMNSTGKSIEEVNQYLDELMWFSDETSFSFTEMTSALGNMTSTGADIEKVIPMIMGMGNAVAYAGKSGAEFVRTIRNLNQSYSAGFLNLMDWKSLQIAGTNSEALTEIIIKTGEAMGKIKEGEVTLSNFTESLKDKWADKEVMERAFGYFAEMSVKAKELIDAGQFDNASDAYAYLAEQFDDVQAKAALAAQQAKSFAEVIDATKDAVSTGWMVTFEHLFGNYEVATSFWTDVVDEFWKIFASGGDKRNSILEVAFGGGSKAAEDIEEAVSGWGKLEKKVKASGHTMEQFESAYEKVVSSTNNANLMTLVDRYGSVENAFKSGAITADLFKRILAELNGMTAETADNVEVGAEQMTTSLDELRRVSLEVLRGDHGNGQERIDWLEANGYDPELIQAMVGNLDNFHKMFGSYDMSDDQLLAAMEAYYQYMGLAERLGASSFADYIASGTASVNSEVSETVDLLEDSDELLNEIQNGIEKVYKAEDELSGGEAFRGGLLNLLGGLRSFVEMFNGKDGVGGAIENVFGTAEERGLRLRHVLNVFYRFTEHIQLSDDAMRGLQKITESVLRVVKIFGTAGGGALKVFTTAIMTAKDIIDDILGLIGRGEFSVGEALDKINERVKGLIPSMDDIKGSFDKIINKLKSSLPTEEKLLGFMRSVRDTAKNSYTSIKNWFSALTFEDIKSALPQMDRLKEIYHSITDYIWTNYPTIAAWLHDLKETSVLGAAFDGFTNFFKNAGEWVQNLGISTENLNETFSKFSEIISTIFDGLFGDPEEFRQKVENFFTTVWQGLKDSVKSLTFSDVLDAFRTAGLGILVAEIAQVVDSFRKIEKEIEGVPQAISKMFSSAGDAFEGLKKSFKATAYLQMAAAIGILAGSMWLLSKIPEDKLTHVASVMVVLALAFNKLSQNLAGNGILGSNNSKTIINVIPKLAATLVSLGIAAAGIAFAVAKLAAIPADAMKRASLAVAGLVGLMALLTFMFSFMDNAKWGNSSGGLLRVAAVIVALAVGVRLLVKPIQELAKIQMSEASLKGVIGAIAAIMAVMTVMTMLLSLTDISGKFGEKELKNSSSGLLKAAGSMILMVVALRMLIKPIKQIADIQTSERSLKRALVAITAILAGMSAFAVGLSFIKGGNALKAAGAMAIMALAINLLMPAILVFTGAMVALATQVPWEQFTDRFDALYKALAPLGGLAIVMMGFGLAAVFIGIGIAALGIGMLAGAGSVLIFSIALFVLTKAFKAISDAFPAIVEGFDKVGALWADPASRKQILLGAGAFVALALALGLLGWSFGKIFGGGTFGKKFSSFTSSLVIGIGNLVSKMGTKVLEEAPKLLNILGALLIMAGLTIVGILPDLTEIIVNALITLFNSVADSFEAHKDEIVDSVTRLVRTFLDVFASVITSLFSKDFISDLSVVEKALFALTTIKVGSDLLGIATPFSKLKDVLGGSEGLTVLIDKAKGAIPELIEACGGLSVLGPIVAALAAAFIYANENINSQQQILKEQAFNGAEETVEGYEEAIARLKNDIAMLQEQEDSGWGTAMSAQELQAKQVLLSNLTAEYEDLKQKTEEAATAEAQYVAESARSRPTDQFATQKADAQEAAATVTAAADNAKAALETSVGEMEATAESGGGNIITKMTSTATSFANSTLYPALGNMSTSVSGAFDGIPEVSQTDGYNFIAGLDSGMAEYWNSGALQSTVTTISSYVTGAFQSNWNEHSPSRVAMELGSYFMEGLTIGFSDGSDSTITEVVGFSSLLVDAISSAMAQVGLIASDDFSISPTITPVVDMSNINAASGMLGNAFGGQYGVSAQLSNSINSRLSDVERLAASMGNQQTINNGDVFNFNIYASEGQDEEAIADAVMNRMQTRMVRRGAAFGA